MRRALSSACIAACLLVWEAVAVAEPASSAPRVVVIASGDASAWLREALVRTQGELRASGMLAEVAAGEAADFVAGARRGSDGLLVLEAGRGYVWIRAWAPGAREPLQARVDLPSAGVTAEVVAVRAVETLRAAMLQSARVEPGAALGAVPADAPAVAKAPPAPPATRIVPPLAFWTGPALSLHAGASPDFGAELGVLVGPRYGFVAAAVETTIGGLQLHGEHGSAEVDRRAAWLELGTRFRPRATWEVATRVAAGYAAFRVTGRGDSGYRGGLRTHGSGALKLGVSTSYWATRWLGLYVGVGVRFATDAPTLLIARERTVTLDRPSFVASLGMSVGVF